MKFVKIAGVTTIVVLALAILGVTLAFAQQPTPTDNPWFNTMRSMMQGNGGGMMGANWESMQNMHNQITQNGEMGAMHEWMHQSGGVYDTVWKALAEQLGLTSEELTAQINSGKTLAQIAEEKGVSTKDLATTMETGMKAGLEQAVKDGKLTQEQADLMIQNMAGQYEWMIINMGAGMMGTGGRGGMMGSGNGMMSPGFGSGGCHDNNPTTDDNTAVQGTDF